MILEYVAHFCFSLVSIRILPSQFWPFPLQTPQNVSFQVFPSIKVASPVFCSSVISVGFVNFISIISRMMVVRISFHPSRNCTFRPAALALAGVARLAIFWRSVWSSVLAAWNACSTVGYVMSSIVIGLG